MLQKILQKNWQWNHCYNNARMIMAWNNKDMPLHNGVLPPFIYGKGTHNSWIIHEAISSEFRFVFSYRFIVIYTYQENPPFLILQKMVKDIIDKIIANVVTLNFESYK